MNASDAVAEHLKHYFHSLVEPLLRPGSAMQRHQDVVEDMVNRPTSVITLRRICGTINTLIRSLDPQDPHRNLTVTDPDDFTSQLIIESDTGSIPFDQDHAIADLYDIEAKDPAQQLEIEAINSITLDGIATFLFLCTIDPVQAQQYIADDDGPVSHDDAELVLETLRYALHRRRTFVGNDDPGTLIIFYEWANADVTNPGMRLAIANGNELAEETGIGEGSYQLRRIRD